MMLDDAGEAVTESECPSCRRLFCAQCAVPWHAGVDCAAYKKLGKGDRGKEDLLVVEMAKGKKWKRCPKCKYFVEKSQGCLHITCRCCIILSLRCLFFHILNFLCRSIYVVSNCF